MIVIAAIIATVALLIGLAFNAVGILGLWRFPDVYTRLHAETKTTTFGTIFITISVIIMSLAHWINGDAGSEMITIIIHAAVAVFVLAATNAAGAHAIARAAYRSGRTPRPCSVDRLEQATQAGEVADMDTDHPSRNTASKEATSW